MNSRRGWVRGSPQPRRALPPQVITTGWWLAYCLALAAFIAWAYITD